jgi:hypothetical protein
MNKMNNNRNGPVELRLRVANGLDIPADLAIIGSGKELISRIEAYEGKRFSKVNYASYIIAKYSQMDGIKRAKGLLLENSLWKYAISFPGRPTNNLRKVFVSEFLEVLNGFIRPVLRPRSVLILPYQDRPVDTVALMSLFVAWSICRLPLPGRDIRMIPDITIADKRDVSIIAEYSGPRINEFTQFAGRQLGRFWWSGEWSGYEAPSFRVIE